MNCKKCSTQLNKCTNCDVLNLGAETNCRKCGHSLHRNYRVSRGGFASITGYFEPHRCPVCNKENWQ